MIEADLLRPEKQTLELSAPCTNLRPRRLEEYRGQSVLKAQLALFIQAALSRQEPLDHLLLFGPPGLGKTTLARIIATELGVGFRSSSGPVLEKSGDLAALLTNLAPYEILFIDEIHRLSPAIEELLYPAMEDRQLDFVIGEGPAARSIKLDLVPFTLIGATTRAGLLTAPLRDRFGITCHLKFYSTTELSEILLTNARELSLEITPEASLALAARARGTPRIANRLLKRARDVTQVRGASCLDVALVEETLTLLGVDAAGFDLQDRRVLELLIHQFQGGPVGLETLAIALGENATTLEEVIEPFLIQAGFLNRTPRGRVATEKAYDHFTKQQAKN